MRANIRTFVPIAYDDEKQAIEDVRNGKLQGAVIIPPQYSRRVYEENHPRIGLVVDNSDNFMSSAVEAELTDLTNALNQPTVSPRILQQTALDIVELYPYIEYMKYLLPGSLVLAMFVSVMIGGGMLYIDDKARGVHEGYLVTPITKLELVLGAESRGRDQGGMTGVIIVVIGSMMAGVGTIFNPVTVFGLLIMIVLTSLAFNTMMFLLMVRIEDPLVPRAMFGILNTLLFFPSGSVYPIQAFPPWLRAIAKVRSVYLCGGWVQMPAAEGDHALGGLGRHAVPLDFRGGHAGDRDSVVQADAVRNLQLIKLRSDCVIMPIRNSLVLGTFRLSAVSVMLERYDTSGRARSTIPKKRERRNAESCRKYRALS